MGTMHKENHAATTGRETGGRRATGGTAVFVGKTSFRMIPETQRRPDDQTQSMAEATPAPSTHGLDATEERVVLAPPGGAALTETARIADIVAQIAHSSEGPLRRAVPIWIVAAALIGGASITLSAQAVMRRPTRTTTATNPAPAPTAATAMPPLLRRPSPIVAPSTLSPPEEVLLPEPRPTTTRVLQSVTTDEGPRLGRNKRKTAHPSPGSRGRKRSSAVKWVDPFATSGPAMLGATTAKTGSATISTKTRWVDPFAN